MNRTLVSITLAAATAFAGTAFAANNDIEYNVEPFVSTKTRADVQAELAQYKAAGVNPWASSYNQTRNFKGQLTRDQVRAEFLASRDEVAALTGEDGGDAYLRQQAARRVPAGTRLAGQPTTAQ